MRVSISFAHLRGQWNGRINFGQLQPIFDQLTLKLMLQIAEHSLLVEFVVVFAIRCGRSREIYLPPSIAVELRYCCRNVRLAKRFENHIRLIRIFKLNNKMAKQNVQNDKL